MRPGIAHHLGWAVVVAASPDNTVVDRRRIELIEPGLPAAPIHRAGGVHRLHQTGEPLTDEALAALVTHARASAVRLAATALDELAATLGGDIELFDRQSVEAEASRILGPRAETVPFDPRARLGTPWTKDHRMALAATVVAK